LARLDLGRSIITQRPVKDELAQRFPATFELIFVAFFLYLVIGIPLGILSALAAGRWSDFGIRVFSVVGYAIPLFVTALWLQYFLYYQLGWFPSGERLPVIVSPPARVTGFYLVDSLLAGNLSLFSASVRHITLPALALALGLIAVATRFTRASMLTELNKDYIKMGHLKGLKKADVIVRHALRNSLIPVVTITAIQFGYLVGGSVLVEAVFLWPGVGFYAYNSVLNLDYAPIMGVTLVTSFIFVMTNLLIDLVYPVLDPRIKLAGR
jgi:peptide/nickel transport system permease protein